MAERPTPHSIAVCTLIALQSDPASPSLSSGNSNTSHEIEAHLTSLLQRLVVVSAPSTDLSHDEELLLKGLSLNDLLQLVSKDEDVGCFQQAANDLLQDLEQSSASVDALEDLFVALEASVAKGRVDGNSVYGVYVRKQCLGFNLLPFESVVRLWAALKEYVDQHLTSSHKPHNSHVQHSSQQQQWPLSEAQILVHLMNQCRLMQQRGEILSFKTIELFLQQILRIHPEFTAALFLRYLNCYFHDERLAALDHLHRYFDYAMIVERKERLANGPSSTASQSIRNIVQYAPILLGTLFHRFGHVSSARKAIEEALRIAQQTGDGACMAYAFAWLHATNSIYATGVQILNSDPSLRQASRRALQLPLQSLFVGTSLRQAYQLLQYGSQPIMHIGNRDSPDRKIPVDFSVVHSSQNSRVIPALAWDHLSAATVFESPLGGGDPSSSSSSSQQTLTSATAFLSDMPCHLLNIEHSINVYDTFIGQQETSSSLWAALGHFPMSHIHTRLCLDSYDNLISTDQVSVAVLNSMARLRYGPGFPFSFSSFTDKMQQGKVYDSDMISDAMAYYCRAFVYNEWYAYQNDWFNAMACQRILHSSLPMLFKYGIEYLIDALGSTALLHIHQNQYNQAKILLDKLCDYCERHSLHTRYAFYLLQKSIMYISIHDPMGALPSLLSCLSVCDSKLIDSMHSAALSILAQIFYETDNLAKCRSILKATLPRLVQYGMIWFVGESWLTMAKCCLAETMSHPSNSQATEFRFAISHLSQAAQAFHAMDDIVRLREVYYLKSHVYHQLGNVVKRNTEAQKFHKLRQRKYSYHYPKWPVMSM